MHAALCQIVAADNANKGNALLAEGYVGGATKHHQTALALHTATTETSLQGAVSQEKDALAADPADGEAHFRLCVNYFAMKRYKSA